jgi:hypothetical protein
MTRTILHLAEDLSPSAELCREMKPASLTSAALASQGAFRASSVGRTAVRRSAIAGDAPVVYGKIGEAPNAGASRQTENECQGQPAADPIHHSALTRSPAPWAPAVGSTTT